LVTISQHSARSETAVGTAVTSRFLFPEASSSWAQSRLERDRWNYSDKLIKHESKTYLAFFLVGDILEGDILEGDILEGGVGGKHPGVESPSETVEFSAVQC
jgi:hypothetical protein